MAHTPIPFMQWVSNPWRKRNFGETFAIMSVYRYFVALVTFEGKGNFKEYILKLKMSDSTIILIPRYLPWQRRTEGPQYLNGAHNSSIYAYSLLLHQHYIEMKLLFLYFGLWYVRGIHLFLSTANLGSSGEHPILLALDKDLRTYVSSNGCSWSRLPSWKS